MKMEGISLEGIIDESRNGNGRFTIDTDLRDFATAIKYETELPTRLKMIFLNHGYAAWGNRFKTIKDLILSYREGVQWSEKSRKVLNYTLTKYGFQELAPKKYARS